MARYRCGETGGMGPEDVFNASKVIGELAEVQKKAASLTKKLEKDGG